MTYSRKIEPFGHQSCFEVFKPFLSVLFFSFRNLAILERYTIVLVKLVSVQEAKAAIDDYIAKRKRDQSRSSFEKICDRVEKAPYQA